MRVAVCLSGQMRSFKECYPNIYQYIIQPNNADVFLHSWYDEEQLHQLASDTKRTNTTFQRGDDQELLRLYQPKAYCIEKPFSFFNPKMEIPMAFMTRAAGMMGEPSPNETVYRHVVNTTYSMMYSIFKCNQLKEEYAYKNNLYYDVVIKLRYDVIVEQPLLCAEYPIDAIYYPDLGHPDELIADWINMGSTPIMNVHASTFLHLEYIHKFQYFPLEVRYPNTLYPSERCTWGNEHLLRDMMTLFNIPKKKLRETYKLHY